MAEKLNRQAMPTSFASDASLYRASTLADAMSALRERGAHGRAIAGATWVMRSGLRGEPQDRHYVSLSGIDEMRRVVISDRAVEIGACVTHTELGFALKDEPRCRGLAEAAAHSANPAVRNVATVGGNLCASDFPAADLVPALMSLDALLDIESIDGSERVSIDAFMQMRMVLEPGRVVRRIIVPLRSADVPLSAHVRLPLRKAGDYPVAIVSIALSLKPNGTVGRARIVVGSVERSARRWDRLEAALIGRSLEAASIARLAEASADHFVGRDGVEAPGWYRVKVLPTLVGRAVEQLLAQ